MKSSHAAAISFAVPVHDPIPVPLPATRLAPGRRAQRRPGRGDAGLGPARRRPRRAGLPHRALPARRPRDLERQLVRRPLHAHLQRPLPAAGGAARPAPGGDVRRRRLLLPLRPPRPRPLGRGRPLGDPLVRRRRRHPPGRRPAHLRPGSRLRPRGAARLAAPPHPLGASGFSGLRPLQPGRRRLARRRPARSRPGPSRLPPAPLPRVAGRGCLSRRGVLFFAPPTQREWGRNLAKNPAPGRAPPARQDPRADRSVGRLPGAGAGDRPQPRLPRRRPVPLRLLLLHGDPAVVRAAR